MLLQTLFNIRLNQNILNFFTPNSNGYDNLARAVGAPVTLNGRKAHSVFMSPGTGYRNNAADGTATGDAAEDITELEAVLELWPTWN